MVVKFAEFDIAHGCWENYVSRFGFCLEVNEVTEDAKKKANLLAVCGPDLFDLILSLIAPKEISEVTYSTIKKLLDSHFHPKPNEIVESFKFHTRNQEQNEKIRDYLACLRKLSIHCNFKDIDRTLRDRLVCGILDKELQRKMLQTDNLTYESACKLALSHESANCDAEIIVPTPGVSKPSPTVEFEEPMEVNKMLFRKVIPSPSKWAEIIGVSGPQAIEVPPTEVTERTKRPRSESPLHSTNKRVDLNITEDEDTWGEVVSSEKALCLHAISLTRQHQQYPDCV
ncbi:hypothetical protein NE865_08263 [Phthorimaea operculella]|nr:hypothetical protein NE865_08263 [Phthorimaea operculella]